MNWWLLVGVPAFVAFVTTVVTEPLKMWLYRNKHVHERRYQMQVDKVPLLVEALGWAGSTRQNAYSGWQIADRAPFEYVDKALAKLIEAINLEIATAYLFPADLRAEVKENAEQLRAAFDRSY